MLYLKLPRSTGLASLSEICFRAIGGTRPRYALCRPRPACSAQIEVADQHYSSHNAEEAGKCQGSIHKGKGDARNLSMKSSKTGPQKSEAHSACDESDHIGRYINDGANTTQEMPGRYREVDGYGDDIDSS